MVFKKLKLFKLHRQ